MLRPKSAHTDTRVIVSRPWHMAKLSASVLERTRRPPTIGTASLVALLGVEAETHASKAAHHGHTAVAAAAAEARQKKTASRCP